MFLGIFIATLPAHAGDDSVAAAAAAPSADPAPTLVSGILEQVVYRVGDEERTVTATLTVVGTDLRLAIFSPILATEYEVRVPSSALVSSRRLTDEEVEAEWAHRRACFAEKERKREIARQKREERKRRELEEQARRGSRGPVTRAERKAREALDREGSAVGSAELDRYAAGLTARLEEVTGAADELLGAVLSRKQSVPSAHLTLREIQGWVEEVDIAAEKLARQFSARDRSRKELREEIDGGSIRPRDMNDQLAAIFDQYELLEAEIEEAETIIAAQRKAFGAVPETEPEPVPDPEDAQSEPEAQSVAAVPNARAGTRGETSASDLAPTTVAREADPSALRASAVTTGTAARESVPVERVSAESVPKPEESRPAATVRAESSPSDVEESAAAPVARSPERAESAGASGNPSTPDDRLPIWPLYILASLAVVLAWRRRAPTPTPLVSRSASERASAPRDAVPRDSGRELTSRSGKPSAGTGATPARAVRIDDTPQNIGLEILESEDEEFFQGGGIPMTAEPKGERGTPGTLPEA